MTEPAYPPPPWRLRGRLYASIFLVPDEHLPGAPLPGLTPLRVAGRNAIVVGWALYEPGGVLNYNELLQARLYWPPHRPTAEIQRIWVDSEASLAGGHALWAIPKELAAFEVESRHGYSAAATGGTGPIAQARFEPLLRAPFRLPTRLALVQLREGAIQRSRARLSGRLALARAEWTFSPAGPLAFLAGRKPLVSLALTEADILFGI